MESPYIIKKIIERKIPCVFISPHLDDAILSCGDLISYLADKTEVKVVTVFTEGSAKPYTLSIKAGLKKRGFNNAEEYFRERRTEDQRVLGSIGAKAIHLSFIDALWRRRKNLGPIRAVISKYLPEAEYLYPVYRLHINSGNIKDDQILTDQITKSLLDLTAGYKEYCVFCPMGVGNHVDHLIVRNVCLKNFPDVIFWSDFPYNRSINYKSSNNPFRFTWAADPHKKIESILGYKTQVKGLFPSGEILLIDEIYWSANV